MLSIVIPAFNAASTLTPQILALVSQVKTSDIEILIVDNGSEDETASVIGNLCAQFPLVRPVDASASRGVNYARNAGVNAARGSVIAFCDADDVVCDGWIDAIVVASENHEFDLFGGPLRRTGGDLRSEISGFVQDLWMPFPSGANCAVRSSVFTDVGTFDESWRGGGDEAEFFWRAQLAGHKLAFVEGALVEYRRRPETSSMLRQQFAYGVSNARLFSEFRTYGMSSRNPMEAFVSTLKSLFMFISPDVEKRTRGAARLALQTGRIWGSISHKVLYV